MNSTKRAFLITAYCLAALLALAVLPGADGAQPVETLRVVTINVWSGLDYRGYLKMGEYEDAAIRRRRNEVLIGQLRGLAPDVVALNEANKLPRYVRQIARELGCDAVWHVGLGGLRAGPVGLPTNLREGDAILARPELGLRRAGRKQLSGGPVGNFFAAHFSDATQVVAARIRVARRNVYLFCTHWHASAFPSDTYLAELERRRRSGQLDAKEYARQLAAARAGQKWRLKEAHRMLAFIERVAGPSPAILMGDFNALPESDEIILLRKAGFLDAIATVGRGSDVTWDEERNTNIQLQHRRNPDRVPDEPRHKRIDYVFVRGPGLTVRRAEVVLDGPTEGLYPSDHFGVLAEVTVR